MIAELFHSRFDDGRFNSGVLQRVFVTQRKKERKNKRIPVAQYAAPNPCKSRTNRGLSALFFFTETPLSAASQCDAEILTVTERAFLKSPRGSLLHQ